MHRIEEEVTEVVIRIKERARVKSNYHHGMIAGRIGVYGPFSSPMGALARALVNVD